MRQDIPTEVFCYEQDMKDNQVRLTTEIPVAMELMEQRYRDAKISSEEARILPLKP